MGVITESFSEQLTFLHEFDQWSLEKEILDGRDCMCKGPEAGGRGRSMEGRSTLNAKEKVWAVFQRVLEKAVAASEGW